jgi:hypothetical protein
MVWFFAPVSRWIFFSWLSFHFLAFAQFSWVSAYVVSAPSRFVALCLLVKPSKLLCSSLAAKWCLASYLWNWFTMVLHHMLFLFLSREILVTLPWTHSLILITWQRLGPQGMSIDWQAAPASPSSHIVKHILRLDIPVDSYPNVSNAFTLECIMLISTYCSDSKRL